MSRFLYVMLSVIFFSSCGKTEQTTESQTKNDVAYINYFLVDQIPHDTTSFTEGLFFYGEDLFESSGSPPELSQTKSMFGIVNQETGKIDVKVELDRNIYFGEGIIRLNDKIFQLTYKNQLCFVYDAKTYKKIKQFKFSNTEGWGLTTDGKYIIMSDGTNILTYRNPDNFQVVKTVTVTENGYVVINLNELEFINGFIYANVWLTNKIVKIDQVNGKVVGKLDLTQLYQKELSINRNATEMNGIAYNPLNKNIYITGKLWSSIYQIGFPH